MQAPRTVHVVDDDAPIRDAVGMMLRSAHYDVHLWPSGPSFLDGVARFGPACVLLDIRMAELSGLEVHAALKASRLPVATIILTGHGDVATAVRALRAGAANFLEKPVESAALVAAVEEALASLVQPEKTSSRLRAALGRLDSLSPREQEVLKGLTAGKQNKSIALALGISPRTVEVYRANIMEKLGARNLSEILYIAFAAGIDGDDNPDAPDPKL